MCDKQVSSAVCAVGINAFFLSKVRNNDFEPSVSSTCLTLSGVLEWSRSSRVDEPSVFFASPFPRQLCSDFRWLAESYVVFSDELHVLLTGCRQSAI
jgi:hypothetical protein